jgi:hypothetical protein
MDKIFIEQAKNLRREFIKNNKDIVNCEEKIEIFKKELIDVKNQMNDEMNEQILREKLILVEKNIKSIEKILEPYTLKIKKLQNDADRLFDSIKERHTNMTTEQIQNELIPHLIEIKFE